MLKFQGAGYPQATLNKPLAYVTGIYLSDGTIGWRGGEYGQFILRCVDKDIVERTADCLEILTDRTPKVFKREDLARGTFKGTRPLWGVRLGCTPLCNWLYHETLNKDILPDGIWESHLDVVRELVAGVMDGDGSISRTKQPPIQYQLKVYGHSGYLIDFEELLHDFEVKTGKRRRDSGLRVYTINLRSFVEAGFCFHCERKQGRLRDYTRDILKRMVI